MSATPPTKPRVVLRPIRPRAEGRLHDPERLEAVKSWLQAPRATEQLERLTRWAALTTQSEAGLCCVISKNHIRIVATHNLALGQFKVEQFPKAEVLLSEGIASFEDQAIVERFAATLGLHYVPVCIRVVPMRFHGHLIGAICVFDRLVSRVLTPPALQLLSELALEAADSADLAPPVDANPVATDNRQAVATLGQQLPVLLFNLDTGGRFAHVEGRALELLELEATQLLGRSAFEVFRNPAQPEFLETLRHVLVSSVAGVHKAAFTWREQRFSVWLTQCGPGLTALALLMGDGIAAEPALQTPERSSQPNLALVALPSVSVALEFINGVGGLGHFHAQMLRDAAWPGERLVLSGRGVKIVVDRGDLSDLTVLNAKN